MNKEKELVKVSKKVDYRLPAVIGPGYFQCDLPGVAGTTQVFIKTVKNNQGTKYIARVGVAIMGSVNDPECFNKNPFDENWFDNYVEAKAYSMEALYRVLQRKMKELQNSLWDE